MPVHVKICGLTSVEDALFCVAAGASAIGLNFVPESPRCISHEVGRAIADAVSGRLLVVAVVADLDLPAIERLRTAVGFGCVQLHGDEPDALVEALLPHAYKAVRVADAADVARAAAAPGDHVLVDARVEGVLGGSGVQIPPALVAELAQKRRLTLAGGLTPENVAAAVRSVRPYAVDVASGVERAGDPRTKDRERVVAFVTAARSVL